jgi:hypothetical protein
MYYKILQEECDGERDGARTHDHLIKSPIQPSKIQQLQGDTSANCGKAKQNPQPPRKQNGGER